MSSETVETNLTKLLGIKYPIFLAGMNKAAGPELAAAVTNAGGIGVIGGVGFTPRVLQTIINVLKSNLKDPNAPYGVDLLLPKVGGSARKTNYDYTKGNIDGLIDVIINSGGCKLFVSAVGVCPKPVVDRLHKHPKHVPKCLAVGVDAICAQGSEAGGHTGNITTSILLPKCVDLCKGHKMTLYPNYDVSVVGAGGIYDGRGLAMALSYGCCGIWVGTRFVACKEAGASKLHKQHIVDATWDDANRTLIYSGRPLRTLKTPYVTDWELNRKDEMQRLLSEGTIPHIVDRPYKEKQLFGFERQHWHHAGQVAGSIDSIKSAKDIIDDMMVECIAVLKKNRNAVKRLSKL